VTPPFWAIHAIILGEWGLLQKRTCDRPDCQRTTSTVDSYIEAVKLFDEREWRQDSSWGIAEIAVIGRHRRDRNSKTLPLMNTDGTDFKVIGKHLSRINADGRESGKSLSLGQIGMPAIGWNE